jgi:hypothetical protein
MALYGNLTAAAAEICQRLADSLEDARDYTAARATYDDAFAFCTASGFEPTARRASRAWPSSCARAASGTVP